VRGDVYRLRSNRAAEGGEQRGWRYGVIVQSDALPLSTVLIAPTSTSAAAADFRPEIELGGQATRVLVEQTGAVNAETRLGEFAGRLEAEELRQVDQALALVMGLY
jgi:mRNA interferase MazF